MNQVNEISKTKQFALEVLECFNELAQTEINQKWVKWAWNKIRNIAFNKILKKPDEEIKEKCYKIHLKLGKMFKDIDMSVEMKKSEKIMGVDLIPSVGELAKTKELMPSNIEELLKELKL